MNHEFKWLCDNNMVIYGVAAYQEYESRSVCRIVALVGFLWWEGWPFAWGSFFLGRFLCVFRWRIVRRKFSLCILEGRVYVFKVGEPKSFTLGRINLEGSRGL
jgi:hypothetical protein